MTTKDKAKRVIAEIVRQSAGDRMRGRTKLFKAFYFAHLFYAKENVDYLTDWPIVRMPHGPGIDKFKPLLNDLVHEGILQVSDDLEGPYPINVFEFLPSDWEPLPKEEIAAIRTAVTFVQPRSGGNLSQLTHELSRSWNAAKAIDVKAKVMAAKNANAVYSDTEDDWHYHDSTGYQAVRAIEVLSKEYPPLASVSAWSRIDVLEKE